MRFATGRLVWVTGLIIASGSVCGCRGPESASARAPAAAGEPAQATSPAALPEAFVFGEVGDGPTFGDVVVLETVMEKGTTRTVRRLMVIGLGVSSGGFYRSSSTAQGVDTPFEIDCEIFATHIQVRDQTNAEVSSSPGGVPMFVFGNSLFQAMEVQERVLTTAGLSFDAAPEEFARAASREDFAAIIFGYESLQAMSLSLKDNKVFNRMLLEAVEKPSLWSMLFDKTRVSITLRPGERPQRTTCTLGNATLPAFRIPMKLTINDTDAMFFDLTVTPNRAPLGLCDGVVAIDAVHPSKPDVKVTVRLIGAQRGKGLNLDQLQPIQSEPAPADGDPSR